MLPLGFTYVSERRAKTAMLSAIALIGDEDDGITIAARRWRDERRPSIAGSGLASRLLRGWWVPLAAWAVLAVLWRIAGLYTRAQGDTVACPPGFA